MKVIPEPDPADELSAFDDRELLAFKQEIHALALRIEVEIRERAIAQRTAQSAERTPCAKRSARYYPRRTPESKDAQRELILTTLQECAGVRSEAARRLKMHYQTLQYHLKCYRDQGAAVQPTINRAGGHLPRLPLSPSAPRDPHVPERYAPVDDYYPHTERS